MQTPHNFHEFHILDQIFTTVYHITTHFILTNYPEGLRFKDFNNFAFALAPPFSPKLLNFSQDKTKNDGFYLKNRNFSENMYTSIDNTNLIR